MASVIQTKVNKDHAVLSLKLGLEEAAQLKGKMDNIHLIAEENADTKASVYERGKKGCTKYFLIPRLLRKGVRIGKEARCLRFDSKDKMVFVYFVEGV
ncbi:hypothetical protein KY366_06950 [Candidatus Woesearchaeota archaeon]|nr:hypothetical protein [Candidatus Woesearchaeota archaeon]